METIELLTYREVITGFQKLTLQAECIISLYCFLSVQYLNYISVFQLIALNIFYKQHIETYVLSKTGQDRTQHTHCSRHAAASIV